MRLHGGFPPSRTFSLCSVPPSFLCAHLTELFEKRIFFQTWDACFSATVKRRREPRQLCKAGAWLAGSEHAPSARSFLLNPQVDRVSLFSFLLVFLP